MLDLIVTIWQLGRNRESGAVARGEKLSDGEGKGSGRKSLARARDFYYLANRSSTVGVGLGYREGRRRAKRNPSNDSVSVVLPPSAGTLIPVQGWISRAARPATHVSAVHPLRLPAAAARRACDAINLRGERLSREEEKKSAPAGAKIQGREDKCALGEIRLRLLSWEKILLWLCPPRNWINALWRRLISIRRSKVRI